MNSKDFLLPILWFIHIGILGPYLVSHKSYELPVLYVLITIALAILTIKHFNRIEK